MGNKSKTIKLVTKIIINVFAFLFCFMIIGGMVAFEQESAINAFLKAQTSITITPENDENRDLEYYKSSFRSVKEVRQNGMSYVESIVAEGSTLLKNDNDALPLAAGSKVSLFSTSSVQPIIKGTGSSGGSTTSDDVYLQEGLETAGLSVNKELYKWYEDNYSKYGRPVSGAAVGSSWRIGDATWEEITTSAKTDANYGDAAIFVLSRSGGEGVDATMFGGADDLTQGNYLKLSPKEKDVLTHLKAEKDKGTFKKIIVLLNTSNHVDSNFIVDPDYGIDAAMWIGTLGSTGAYAVGDLLVGNVNPSGKLPDTFWADNTLNPVNANFGTLVSDDGAVTQSSNNYTIRSNPDYDTRNIVYQEGVYMGYRYTETRYEDVVTKYNDKVGDFDYEEVVTFPFGYGLSYTDFDYSDIQVERIPAKVNVDGTKEDAYYNVSVTVTNNGERDGKEAVQIYLQKPYTQYDIENNIGKPSVELVGFEKTGILKASGGSERVTVKVSERDFASYDAYGTGTYIVDAGTYYLTAANGAHDAINNILAKKGKTVEDGMTENGDSKLVYAKEMTFDDETYSTARVTGAEITNQFDNADLNRYENAGEVNKVEYMTREDWTGTVHFGWNADGTRTLDHVDVTMTPAMIEGVEEGFKVPEAAKGGDYPKYGLHCKKENGQVIPTDDEYLKLIELRAISDGVDDTDPTDDKWIPYDDPMWETLLDQLSWEDTLTLITSGFRLTMPLDTVAKPGTVDHNGATGPVMPYSISNSGLATKLNDPDKDKNPVAYPCNGLVAATFNKDLCEYYGKQWGEDGLWAGYAGLYGTGLNTHRSPYGGRNFEYYSEDPILGGVIAAEVSRGMSTRGVYSYLKHAFLNEQETYRIDGFTWATEQSIREIYLKAFQIAIEDGGAQCIMSGLNNLGLIWTGSQGFIKNVLRGEFGMTGHAVTDTRSNDMTYVRGIFYGTDLPDGSSSRSNFNFAKPVELGGSGEYGNYAWAMREAAHRILYTVVHSNAMNGYSADTILISITPWWKKLLVGLQIGSGVILLLGIVVWTSAFVIENRSKRGEAKRV